MEKKQMKTRITGLLALALAFMMLFSNSLPVMAATYDVYRGGLSIGDEVVGGDLLEGEDSGKLYIYIDNDLKCEDAYDYTVPAGTYQVSNLIDNTSAYGDATIRVYLTPATSATPAAPAEPAEPVTPATPAAPHVHIWEVKEVLQAADADTDAYAVWACACGATKNEAIPNTGFATFLEDSCDEILNVEENGTVEINTGIWYSLKSDVIEAIKEREDLTVKVTMSYEGEEYLLVFPAGRDMSVLEEADWYGVLYLNQFFGVAPETDAE